MTPEVLSPGEQPRTPPLKLRRVLMLLLLCAAPIAVCVSQVDKWHIYQQYFSEQRAPASLDLTSLSEQWTESTLQQRFHGHRLSCHPYEGPLEVQRACAVRVRSLNGVPTLYLAFFFAGGRLDQVAINVPWWSHGTAYQYLERTLGHPAVSEPLPHNGVRLHGWQLRNGAAVFMNRDRDTNPLQWSGIHWHSASACKKDACFSM